MYGDTQPKKHFPNRTTFREWADIEASTISTRGLPSVLNSLLDWYKLNEWDEVLDCISEMRRDARSSSSRRRSSPSPSPSLSPPPQESRTSVYVDIPTPPRNTRLRPPISRSSSGIHLAFDDIVPGSSDDDDQIEGSDAEMEWRGTTPANTEPSTMNDGESPDLGDLVAGRMRAYLRTRDSPEYSRIFMDVDIAPTAAGPSTMQKPLPTLASRHVQLPPLKARAREPDFVSIHRSLCSASVSLFNR